jgi:hypothetical protein
MRGIYPGCLQCHAVNPKEMFLSIFKSRATISALIAHLKFFKIMTDYYNQHYLHIQSEPYWLIKRGFKFCIHISLISGKE